MKTLNINKLNPGSYVVAVSGGVDSVVLLNLLVAQKDLNLIVAHINHGIRKESYKDEALAEGLAKKYNLRFEKTMLKMGLSASEEAARKLRYEFLQSVAQKYRAKIVTAHHQDDVIETAFINLIRGTGSRGLASLKSTTLVSRPMLGITKKEILDYAEANKLTWIEDVTNNDKTILRNKIRHEIIAKMAAEQRENMLKIIENANSLNSQLDKELAALMRRGLHKGQPILNRSWFCKLPHDISKEVIRKLLLENSAKDIDKRTIERVVVAIKTLPHGKTLQAPGVNITLTKRSARLKNSGKTDKKAV